MRFLQVGETLQQKSGLRTIGRAQFRPSALDTIARKEQKDMFHDPLIQDLTFSKWQKFGRLTYKLHFAFFFIYVSNYTGMQASANPARHQSGHFGV